MKSILFTLIFLLCLNGSKAQDVKTLEVVEQMIDAIDRSDNMTFKIVSQERIEGKLMTSKFRVKLSLAPRKTYMYSETPNPGAEILYNPDLYGADKALIFPGYRLTPNVKLDIKGKLMMRNQHHCLTNMGFLLLKDIVIYAKEKAGAEFDQVFKLKEDVEFDGAMHYQLLILDPTYSTTKYTVQSGEDIFSISKKLRICEYTIIELNNNVSGFNDLSEGMEIIIPTSYAPTSTILINKENFLPLKQVMEDDKGIFEQYEFFNLEVLPTFNENTFSPDNKEYGF